MHIFLAGSTGVLGRRIVALLVDRGHQVTALTRDHDKAALLRALGAEPVVGDALQPARLTEAVTAAAPDVLMHQLTDLSAADTAANANLRIHGTRNLMDAARAAGVRRVIAQSIAWAYAAGDTPADEAVPLDLDAAEPRRTSVRAVAALEHDVAEAAEWVVLRYGLLYGPGTWYHPDGSLAARAREGRLSADTGISSFLHIDDAASAAAQALDWPSGPVNICDDEPAAGSDWVPVFGQSVGAPAVVLDASTSASDAPAADRVAGPAWARGADNHHARGQLGWSPRYRSWREGFPAMATATDAARDAATDGAATQA